MRRTPLLTLLAGLLLGAVLTALSAYAAAHPARQAGPPPATASAKPSAVASPSAAAPPVLVNAIWAGEVDGGGATIAISVHDGVAVAYLCDGKRAEAWLQGTAAAGKLTLTGKNGASLTGTFGGGKAIGTVLAAGKQWTFTAPTAEPPSGLYRAAEIVNSAKVVCGWIVLANGKQVGVCTAEGQEPKPAPALNTATAKLIDPREYS